MATAAFIFIYYTLWAIVTVRLSPLTSPFSPLLVLLATLRCVETADPLTWFTQPLLPADAYLQSFFPDRVWAIRLPALALVVGLSGIGAFVGMVFKKEADKKRKKEAQRIVE